MPRNRFGNRTGGRHAPTQSVPGSSALPVPQLSPNHLTRHRQRQSIDELNLPRVFVSSQARADVVLDLADQLVGGSVVAVQDDERFDDLATQLIRYANGGGHSH